MRKVKNRILKVRKETGLTIQQVADLIGVGNATISRYETGAREPNLETWEKLARVFNVPVPYLQGIADDPDDGPIIEISDKESEEVIKKFNALGAIISALDIANLDSAIDEVKSYREPENATDDDIKATAEEMRDVLSTVVDVFYIGTRGLLAGQQARNTLQAIDKLTIKYDNEGAKKDIMARREDEES